MSLHVNFQRKRFFEAFTACWALVHLKIILRVEESSKKTSAYFVVEMESVVTVVLVPDTERLWAKRAFVLSFVCVSVDVLSERWN